MLTFDPRGQGRSDNSTPDGEQGSNANPDVFVTNTIDAVDFLRSTPERPYPPNEGDPRATTAFNPLHERIDRERLGLAGHSLGATGVSVVQGTGLAGYEVEPRVPAMGQSGDYFLTVTPYTAPPDPDDKRQGFLQWQAAGVPAVQLVIEGGTHYEWSLLPTFPATAWEPGGDGGWGNPLAKFYTLAWFDRWLKQPGEPGFDDADARLLGEETAGPGGPTWRQRLSFYFHSSRDFPDRDGTSHVCQDIRVGCVAAGTAGGSGASGASGDDPSADDDPRGLAATGGGAGALAVLLLASAAVSHRRHRPGSSRR